MLLCLTAVVFVCTAKADSAPFTLTVQPFADASTRIDWWYSFPEDRYYFFLPAGTDTAALRLFYTCDGLTLNGTAVENGGETDLLTANAELTVQSGGETYALTVLCSERIPAMFIHTASGSLEAIHADKDYKEAATLTLAENGALTLIDSPLKHIKGRGNTTWISTIGKKPYNIRFEKKTDLLGMGAAKKWSLLANHFDESLLRNTIALDAARRMGIPYAVDCRPADLYINGGYLGNYLVCESVQVDPERVDIRDMEKENEEANPDLDLDTVESLYSDPEKPLTLGSRKWVPLENAADVAGMEFLLELDLIGKYELEPAGFISNRGQCVILKSPEHATKAQVDAAADLYQEFEDALFGENGFNAKGNSYLDYIDLQSFAESYLLLEYTMDIDYTLSSFFLTADLERGRLKAGPAWDFDVSFANYQDRQDLHLKEQYVNIWSIYKNLMQENSLFFQMSQLPQFLEAVRTRWTELSPVTHTALEEDCILFYYENSASALMNVCRWWRFPGGTLPEKRRYYERKVFTVYRFLSDRAAALDRGFADRDALMGLVECMEKINAGEIPEVEPIPEAEMTMPPDPSPPQEPPTEQPVPQASAGSSNKTVWLFAAAAGGLLLLLIPAGMAAKQKRKRE